MVVFDILKSGPDVLRSNSIFLADGDIIAVVGFNIGLVVLDVTLLEVSSFGSSSLNSTGPSSCSLISSLEYVCINYFLLDEEEMSFFANFLGVFCFSDFSVD